MSLKQKKLGGTNIQVSFRNEGHSPYHKGSGSNRAADLPDAATIIRRLGLWVYRTNAAGFMVLKCPFHKNGAEREPSLNMHKVEGYYLCHACGARGGGVVDFIMMLNRVPFKTAIHLIQNWK